MFACLRVMNSSQQVVLDVHKYFLNVLLKLVLVFRGHFVNSLTGTWKKCFRLPLAFQQRVIRMRQIHRVNHYLFLVSPDIDNSIMFLVEK